MIARAPRAHKPGTSNGKLMWPHDVAERAGVPVAAVTESLRAGKCATERQHEDYCCTLLEVRALCVREGWKFIPVMTAMMERWLERPVAPTDE